MRSRPGSLPLNRASRFPFAPRFRATRRRGRVATRLLAAVVLLATLAGGGWYLRSGSSSEGPAESPVTTEVVAGPFLDAVVERGEIESSSNVEIRCEVKSRNSGGTTILEIVPEGAYVQQGDLLVRLDDSALQTELLQQEIVCNNSHAQVVDASAELEAARLQLQEYESGTYKQEEEELESKVFVAQENLRRAEEYLRFSEKLAERGYVSDVQLEADQFAVEKASKELDVARTQLTVLRDYTRKKMVNQYTAAIETAEARLKSQENSYKLDMQRLDEIRDQLAKCVIKAPASGQVVYANDQRGGSSGDLLIAEGRQVRERQVIIRLPDPKAMQVIAKINESKIDRVREGMKTHIRIDAFPDAKLSGTVRKVGEYPIPQTIRWMDHIKEYATEIVIDDPPPGLRAGMTAEVSIEVEKLDNVVQVPPQAVFERDERFYCLVGDEQDALRAREVRIGAGHETAVVVRQGLRPGETVVLNPTAFDVPLPSGEGGEVLAASDRDTGEPDAAGSNEVGGRNRVTRLAASASDGAVGE